MRAQTLIEAWEKCRKLLGDDIAQQAMLQTLKYPREDAIAYFIKEAKLLESVWFTDGKTPDPRKARKELFVGTEDDFDFGKLKLQKIVGDFSDALLEFIDNDPQKKFKNMIFRSDPTICSKGHSAVYYFLVKAGKRKGSWHKQCRVCHAEYQRAFKRRKKC